ncbi:MAG: hypothetical protein ACLPQY_02540, partial [Streptosporangiaceae bacterium]
MSAPAGRIHRRLAPRPRARRGTTPQGLIPDARGSLLPDHGRRNHILNPVVMSRTTKLNPLLVLVAILVGTWVGDW